MQGSFQENMIAWFNIDITAIDSSCGVGTEETIQIAL